MIDFLQHLLFESPLLLIFVEFIAVAVALAVHRHVYTARSRRAIWITMAVSVLLLILQSVVVTDREAVEAVIRQMAHDVSAGDMPALAANVDDSFQTQKWASKKELLDSISSTLQRWQVQSPGLGGFHVDTSGGEATAAFHVTCDLRSPDTVQDNTISYWTIHCVKRPDGWKMDRIVSAKFVIGGLDILRSIP